MNRRRNSWSAANDGARIFSATIRFSRWSRARNTVAIPPAPTAASSRYPATSDSGPKPAQSREILAQRSSRSIGRSRAFLA